MSRNNVADVHFAAGLLKIESSLVVFAGGGKGTYGQRLHIAKRGGYFIGEGEGEKIGGFIGAKILKGKHGDGRWISSAGNGERGSWFGVPGMELVDRGKCQRDEHSKDCPTPAVHVAACGRAQPRRCCRALL